MEKGFWDIVTEQLKKEMHGIRGEVRSMFKGKIPYRTKPMSKDEAIADYLATDERVKESLRQQFPQYTQHEEKMIKDMEDLNG